MSSLRSSKYVLAAIATVFVLSVTPTESYATIVERVVAVVGERPILLSELRGRAKPLESQLTGDASSRAAGQSQLYARMLDRMVDEELMRRAAARAKVSVSEEEIDAAMARVAEGNQVTVEELLVELERSGISRLQYRRELRTQLIDAKVMNLRIQGRIQVSEEDIRTEYRKLVAAERGQLEVRIAVIRVPIPNTTKKEQLATSRRLARSIAEQANQGADFRQLSQRYSPGNPEDGELLPPMTPDQMPEELGRAVMTLEVGEVSRPIRSQNHWVLIKLAERAPSGLPPFEEAKLQLMQRVQLDKMEKVRRRWLDDMRKRTHVEIRL